MAAALFRRDYLENTLLTSSLCFVGVSLGLGKFVYFYGEVLGCRKSHEAFLQQKKTKNSS